MLTAQHAKCLHVEKETEVTCCILFRTVLVTIHGEQEQEGRAVSLVGSVKALNTRIHLETSWCQENVRTVNLCWGISVCDNNAACGSKNTICYVISGSSINHRPPFKRFLLNLWSLCKQLQVWKKFKKLSIFIFPQIESHFLLPSDCFYTLLNTLWSNLWIMCPSVQRPLIMWWVKQISNCCVSTSTVRSDFHRRKSADYTKFSNEKENSDFSPQTQAKGKKTS